MTNKKKIIVRLSGGIGNQMFQYATSRAISFRNNGDLLLDLASFKKTGSTDTPREFSLNNFNIWGRAAGISGILDIGLPNMEDVSILGKIKRKIFRTAEYFSPLHKKKFIVEPAFTFCPDILKIENNCYLSGVWQSEKYFKDVEGVLKKEFTLKNKPSVETKNWIEKVAGCNSVSIHIRRGDYINNPKTNQFHGVCSLEYYNDAIKLISQKINDPVFFIFSDDIDWAKANLKIDYPIFYVSDKKTPDYEELAIMSKCRHNIIANSSFSWWGAWLNENPDKIAIAPKKWFAGGNTDTKDLIPPSWTKL